MENHDTDHREAGIEEVDHVPQPGGRLTGSTVGTVRDNLLKDGLLFRLDDEGIARHFTSYFFSGNAWKAELAELRDVVADLDGCPENIPADATKFASWVRRELLEFKHLPADKLNELHDWASSDLASILANIAYCKARLNELERGTRKSEADNSEVGFYRHFLARNLEARDEIIDVLAHRIRHEALRAAYGPWFKGIDGHVPWGFRWLNDRYSAEKYSPIAHAFRELDLEEYHHVQQLHREGRWAEFDGVLASYIEEHNPSAAVRTRLDEHHLLAARNAVLVPALDAYDRGEFALFASAVAIQIEGIFEDACHLADVSLDELRVATLVPKLDALLRKGNVRIDYPYYAFKFPAVRNRVAHGRLIEDDLERTAQLLLLDLHDACRVVVSHWGPQNALVRLLRRTVPLQSTVRDLIEFAVLYAETDGEGPAAFYGLGGTFDEMKDLLERAPLWAALGTLIALNREQLDAGIRFVATRLGKLRPALSAASKEILASLGGRGSAGFDRTEFIAAVGGLNQSSELSFTAAEIRGQLLGVLKARSRWIRTAEGARRLWEQRGRPDGSALDDWLEAEAALGSE